MARGHAVCSPSYELTSSSPVRARRSTTSTAAFCPRACSGRWSCPVTPSRSATTGGGRRWKPRMSACWTASVRRADQRPGQRQLQGPVGGHRAAGASRQGLGGPTHRPGGLPRPLRHRAVDRDILRVGGRLQLHGQGRHRPRLCPVRPRAQRHLPLIGMPVGGTVVSLTRLRRTTALGGLRPQMTGLSGAERTGTGRGRWPRGPRGGRAGPAARRPGRARRRPGTPRCR
jgi:hypothetical protein